MERQEAHRRGDPLESPLPGEDGAPAAAAHSPPRPIAPNIRQFRTPESHGSRGTYQHEPGTHTIATIRGEQQRHTSVETLDLAVLSPKRRNPSSAR